MYLKGRGVRQDYAAAEKWYRLAAEKGHAVAQFNIGIMYLKGVSLPKDNVRAYMWFNLADSRGYSDAAKVKEVASRRMTPEQIAEAQRLAREWKPKK